MPAGVSPRLPVVALTMLSGAGLATYPPATLGDGGGPVAGHGDCDSRDGLVHIQSGGGVEAHAACRGGDQLIEVAFPYISNAFSRLLARQLTVTSLDL